MGVGTDDFPCRMLSQSHLSLMMNDGLVKGVAGSSDVALIQRCNETQSSGRINLPLNSILSKTLCLSMIKFGPVSSN